MNLAEFRTLRLRRAENACIDQAIKLAYNVPGAAAALSVFKRTYDHARLLKAEEIVMVKAAVEQTNAAFAVDSLLKLEGPLRDELGDTLMAALNKWRDESVALLERRLEEL